MIDKRISVPVFKINLFYESIFNRQTVSFTKNFVGLTVEIYMFEDHLHTHGSIKNSKYRINFENKIQKTYVIYMVCFIF